MMVVLFRHGPAGRRDAARWPDDAERPLTERGAERTRAAALGLVRLLDKLSLVLTSPLVRAEQTAKLLADVGDTKVEKLDALAPGHALRAVIRRVAECRANDVVALVGHEPDLGALAGVLVGGHAAPALPLKKAGAALIAFVGPVRAGEGRLTALLPPRVLRHIAGKRHRA